MCERLIGAFRVCVEYEFVETPPIFHPVFTCVVGTRSWDWTWPVYIVKITSDVPCCPPSPSSLDLWSLCLCSSSQSALSLFTWCLLLLISILTLTETQQKVCSITSSISWILPSLHLHVAHMRRCLMSPEWKQNENTSKPFIQLLNCIQWSDMTQLNSTIGHVKRFNIKLH